MTLEKMQRVSRKKPCPICQRPDWCLISEDGSAAICPRTPDGSVKEIPGSGYLHILREDGRGRKVFCRRIVVDTGTDGAIDFGPLTKQYQSQITAGKLNTLAVSLGVSTQSLKRLRVGWAGQAYTFPMSDANGKIIGIRRRFPSGSKISTKGSKNGLFIPTDLQSEDPLLIVEGESDLAAALDLNFAAIGRPNCNSKIEMTAKVARGRAEIVIIGDADEVGRVGAEKLGDALAIHYPSVKIIYPLGNIKDLREWLRVGLTSKALHRIIEETEPIRLKIAFRD